jgi:hypothetical protein
MNETGVLKINLNDLASSEITMLRSEEEAELLPVADRFYFN